ncbi:MAG TPA: sulfotransferase [Steroidobacteraceae bacterium]|jgi:Flp pilus assembly protein TadD|nr:sulfotransferase [Steroidobacteraceae bacterium]
MSTESAADSRAAAARLYGAGRYLDALKAASLAVRAQPRDAAAWNLGAGAALALGLTTDAEKFLRAAISLDPASAEAHSNLGVLNYRRGTLEDAARCFGRALSLAPDSASALNNLGAVLVRLNRLDDAEALLRRAAKLEPGNADAASNLGQALILKGRFDEARTELDRALALKPRFPEALVSRGRLAMEAGEHASAVELFDAAIEASPDCAAAHQNRTLVTRAERGAPWVARLEAAYARRQSLAPEACVALNFAMAKVREELGEYDAAFSAYAEANRGRLKLRPFDEAAEEHFHTTLAALGGQLLASGAQDASIPPDAAAHVPVFVVGMPRSGTSLIEQVLASHAAISGAGELPLIGELLARLPSDAPAAPAERRALCERLRALGAEYCGRVWGADLKTRFVVDKMPGNYRFLGLIALMLPQARIIHVRRDPLDTCLSCFATPFTDGHDYASDLSALARQYLRYERHMQHWRAVLPPGRILEVRYEDLINDLEGQARRMLGHIGVPWDENCLRFHRTARPVRTASMAQVRQPIYSVSIGRWKRFERDLKPLRGLLAPVLDPLPAALPRAAVG